MTFTYDPNYWEKIHEPLNIILQRVVRDIWTESPPVSPPFSDIQLKFFPYYAGKHCLESIALSRLANEGGAHAVSVGLLRDAVESLTVVTVSICKHPNSKTKLEKWFDDKLKHGELRKFLEDNVWGSFPTEGLWGSTWCEFWKDLASAVQPYAHFTSQRMGWHQHFEMINKKFYFYPPNRNPKGDFEGYKFVRISAFQALLYWAFSEIIVAFNAAPQLNDELSNLATNAKQWLSQNQVFFQDQKWEIQLLPFVFQINLKFP